MSSWSKWLAPVTVSTGGWAWVWSTSDVQFTATIPAGTYATYMHMMSTLGDQITTAFTDHAAAGNVWVTSTAITKFNATKLQGVIWASSNTTLLSTMGFDQTETPTSTVITANHLHGNAWYPGLLSLPSSGGVGLEDDTGNEPQDTSIMTYSGSGKGRGVGPARDIYERTVRFGAIKTEEYNDKLRGPICMLDRWKHKVLWWVFDRSDVLVSSYSTQVDPGYPNWEADGDGAYVKAFIKRMTFTRITSTPRWRTVTVTFNVEPK